MIFATQNAKISSFEKTLTNASVSSDTWTALRVFHCCLWFVRCNSATQCFWLNLRFIDRLVFCVTRIAWSETWETVKINECLLNWIRADHLSKATDHFPQVSLKTKKPLHESNHNFNCNTQQAEMTSGRSGMEICLNEWVHQ